MKKAAYSVRMDAAEKKRLESLAKDHGLSFTGLLTKGGGFYGSFPPEFLEQIENVSLEMGLSVETIIIHSVMDKVAAQSAWVEIFGSVPKGVMRPFKWKGGRLVTGDVLFETLCDEYREKFTKLKDNLEKAKDGKRLFLSEDEAFELMAAI